MKRALLTLIVVLMLAPCLRAQIEQGDTEVSFMGYFASVIGEDIDPNGAGTLQLSYGKYITSRLQVGIAPILTFFTAQNDDGEDILETSWSGSAFFNFNFSTASKFIPYLTGQYYQFTFDIPEGSSFTDFSYVNVGIGFKNFFNEYAAWNTLVAYGFSLAEGAQNMGLLSIQTGLSFIF